MIGKDRPDAKHRQLKWIKAGIIASAFLALASVCAILWILADSRRERASHEALLERFTGEVETVTGQQGAWIDWDGSGASLQVDFAALLEENGDVVAWLQIPGSTISYPVLHAEDNEFYTTHAFDGRESNHGAIFLECTNAAAFTDRNSIIYGHNMRDTSMFGSLRAHFLADAAETVEPFFYLYLPDGSVNRYLVFSYYDTGEASDTYSTFTADDAYDYYVYYAQTLSAAGKSWEDVLREVTQGMSPTVTDVENLSEEETVVAELAQDGSIFEDLTQVGIEDGSTQDDTGDGSAVSSDTLFATRPPIVTLSTCVGSSGTSKRFVVHGVLCGTVKR